MPSETQQSFISLRKKYIEQRFGRLNEMQKEAVFTTKGPLLILAGAGSGKTTVLVNRIANLILFGEAYHTKNLRREPTPQDVLILEKLIEGEEQHAETLAPLLVDSPIRPWNVLAITFTNKAAGELKSRLRDMLGPEMGSDVNASTFHSMCVRMLRREAEKAGFPQNFTIYDSDDQQRVLKEIYKQLNIDDKFLAIRSCLSAIGRLKDRMLSPSEAEKTASDTREQLIAQVYKAYAMRCKRAGALDFDDLIYYTVKILTDFPEVREYYQNRFKYILVDEYQDTSIAQFQLVNLLSGPERNVCVVGDDDQSIYRFRGATIENILSFEQHFPGAKVIRLEQNYRSTANILNAANSVIQNNQGRKGKTLWTGNSEGGKIQYYIAENEQDEAMHIAEVIGQHVAKGESLPSHAVLYRMNAQSSPVENYFARSGIPYKIVGGLRFNDRKEIKDIHAYMSIISNPQDNLRLRRIINEPSRKIGAVTLDTVAQIADSLGVPMLEIIRDVESYPALGRASSALKDFYNIYQRLLEANEQLPLEKFVAEIPEITGYNAMLKAQGEEGITRLENIGQLISNVKTYTDQHGLEATLDGYLEEIALISDIDSYDEDADSVVMMTLHSAKGLEFPYVFIVGLEEGIFPSEMSRWSDQDLEEERRLCYVGITRAEKELYLSSAESRMLYGQTRRNQPSRFMEEIQPELLQIEASIYTMAHQRAKRAAAPPKNSPGYLDKNYNRKEATYADYTTSSVQPASRPTTAASATLKNKDNNYQPGDKVQHKVFGAGTVVKVTPIAGDCIVEIRFEKVGVKKTMANYAPLTKI